MKCYSLWAEITIGFSDSVSLFKVISTFVGYLMSKSSLQKNMDGTI